VKDDVGNRESPKLLVLGNHVDPGVYLGDNQAIGKGRTTYKDKRCGIELDLALKNRNHFTGGPAQ
jgi:hypothetical protein